MTFSFQFYNHKKASFNIDQSKVEQSKDYTSQMNTDVVQNYSEFRQNVKKLGEYIDEEEKSSLRAASTKAQPKNKGTVNIRQTKQESFKFGKGDTLNAVLKKAGLSEVEAMKAALVLEKHYDPRRIKPGQKGHLTYKRAEDNKFYFYSLSLNIDPIKYVSLYKHTDGNFKAEEKEVDVTSRSFVQEAKIEISLYGSAEKAGIPLPVIAEAIRIYSWDVDFQRDIRQGDKIRLMYDILETPDGTIAKYGDIMFAELSVNGHKIPLYRFETPDGNVDYYSPEGQSVRKTLMKTPIKHPILGYNKMHKGTDFAAPTGTPIYAAGDGVVEKAGRNGGYGNYIRLRHNSSLKTAYAHLNKFARGISVGKRVKQGSVIGYVGTTGRSTGPHLHYEVLLNGTQVNPKTVKTPQGETLKGQALASFQKHIEKVKSQYAALEKNMKFASLDR
jgi:murein DD-endopeptidase MepM/ murein hydrolase activator NlpD